MMILTSKSAEQTEDIARQLALNLEPCVIALVGDLGAGKTCFSKGFTAALGFAKEEVSSPTFAIVHEYPSHPPILHLDLYRLEEDELPNLGLEEMIDGHVEDCEGFVLVEWANKHSTVLPKEHLEIHFEVVAEHRQIRIRSTPRLGQTVERIFGT